MRIRGVFSVIGAIALCLSVFAAAGPAQGTAPRAVPVDGGMLGTGGSAAGLQPGPIPTGPGSGDSWSDGPMSASYTLDLDNASYWKQYAGGPIDVSGKKIGGDLTVRIRHIRSTAPLIVTVNGNEVGGNLQVAVDDNPFLMDLVVMVGGNRVGGDIFVSASDNAVNNLKLGAGDNRACFDVTVRVNNNSIDRIFDADIRNNNASGYLVFELSRNHYPSGWDWLFHKMKVEVEDNHAVTQTLRTYIQNNRLSEKTYAKIEIDIKKNGAGVDVWSRILDNRAIQGEIFINVLDNESDNYHEIFIYGNKAVRIVVDVQNNSACSQIRVIVQTDAIGPVANNQQKCMQAEGADSDGDGLSDRYERMAGVNPAKKDTDDDGLSDGWDDKNGDRRWTAGERHGEIGDPGNDLKFSGSVMFITGDPNHDPNPLCADIYVEIDFLTGQKNFPDGAVTLLRDEFGKHRIKLHVDNGWGRTAGGGQQLKHKCEKRNGNEFLHFGIIIGERNHFYDFKQRSKYFDPLREDIFHYAIISEYISYVNSTGHLVYSTNVTGIAEYGGDDFMIAGKSISDWVKKTFNGPAVKDNKVKTLAKTFMHELGHNMKLDDVAGASMENKTVMYGSPSAKKPLDYREPSEWAAIRPADVVEPGD